jgi:hypothetical protein
MHRRHALATLCLYLGLAALGTPATAADLHVIQEFRVQGPAGPILTQQRDVYVQGTKLALQSPQGWLIIRPDLQTAWLLGLERQILSTMPLTQLQFDAAGPGAAPASPAPLTATGESKTIAGLPCRVYRGSTPSVAVEVCVTRALPTLEQFSTILGGRPEVPGIPLDFTIVVAPAGQPPHRIAQRVVRIETARLDRALFTVPSGPPAGSPATRLP